jgi:hypothetical protein
MGPEPNSIGFDDSEFNLSEESKQDLSTLMIIKSSELMSMISSKRQRPMLDGGWPRRLRTASQVRQPTATQDEDVLYQIALPATHPRRCD